MKVYIPDNELKAARLFVCEESERFNICGVRIEATKKQMLLIATDGRQMAIIKSHGQVLEPGNETIAIDAIDDAVAISKPGDMFLIDVQTDDLRITPMPNMEEPRSALTSMRFPKNQTYPNWRVVMPPEQPFKISTIQFSDEIIGNFLKAAKLLLRNQDIQGVAMTFTEECGPIRVCLTDWPDFFGVMMPMKATVNFGIPAWVK